MVETGEEVPMSSASSSSSSPIVADVVELHDLGEPTFSAEAQEMLGMIASIVDQCPLDSEAIHRQASADLGLDDFGPRDYVERLDLLLDGYRGLPGLTPAGQVNYFFQMVQLLKNRLLLTDLLRRHPEIQDVELIPPLVIAGLPRSGTTHLQHLLAATGRFRVLPYWESLEPFVIPAERGVLPDPRWQRCEQGMTVMHAAVPHLVLMHEIDTPDHIHEEIALLANDFSTMYFETMGDLPAWRDYYRSHDQEPHYAYLRLQLQAVQYQEGQHQEGQYGAELHHDDVRRWLLKSPQHLEQLPVLDRVFPGATIVITHRDPVHIATSMATMIAYADRMFRHPVDPHRVGAVWAERLGIMLDDLVRDRDLLTQTVTTDLHFDDFLADQIGAVEKIMALAGEKFTDDARAGVAGYLESHTRGHLGRVDYRPEQVGHDPAELRERFAPYTERFLAGTGND
jgi:hypothetical protein